MRSGSLFLAAATDAPSAVLTSFFTSFVDAFGFAAALGALAASFFLSPPLVSLHLSFLSAILSFPYFTDLNILVPLQRSAYQSMISLQVLHTRFRVPSPCVLRDVAVGLSHFAQISLTFAAAIGLSFSRIPP